MGGASAPVVSEIGPVDDSLAFAETSDALWARLLGHGWWPSIFVGIGMLMGGRALSDNSFLTHLATGRLIRSSGVPHHDVYTFASRGTPLVVQSWLASWFYATLEAVGGAFAIRVAIGIVTASLILVLWRLSSPATSLLARVGLVLMACVVGLMWWNERPQIFAFLLLGLTALILTERRSAAWLVPLFALWVNVHGSFPFGLAYIGVAVVLAVFDDLQDGLIAAIRRHWRWALAVVGAPLIGVVSGALVSPFGVELLTFPMRLTDRSDVLSLMAEWKPLNLSEPSARVFLIEVCLVGALLVWRRAWLRFAISAAFVAAALVAVRNVPIAALVMIPIAAPTMAGIGDDDQGTRRSRCSLGFVSATVAVLSIVWMAATPDYDLSPYPVAAVNWMESNGWAGNPKVRVLTHDYDGAYLESRFGAHANTWLDDRAEVHSFTTTRDYVFLLSGIGDPAKILGQHPHELVMWERHTTLAEHLEKSPSYAVVYRDSTTVIACRLHGRLNCGDALR